MDCTNNAANFTYFHDIHISTELWYTLKIYLKENE